MYSVAIIINVSYISNYCRFMLIVIVVYPSNFSDLLHKYAITQLYRNIHPIILLYIVGQGMIHNCTDCTWIKSQLL